MRIEPPERPQTRRDESVTMAVIKKLAAHYECDPLDLDPPIGRIIDCEALDRLFRWGASEASGEEAVLTFEYVDSEVQVSSDGTVQVTEIDPSWA